MVNKEDYFIAASTTTAGRGFRFYGVCGRRDWTRSAPGQRFPSRNGI